MRTARLLAAAPYLAAVIALGACRPPSTPAPRPRTTLRFSTGTPGGSFFPLGRELEAVFGDKAAAVEVEPQKSVGSIENLVAIQEGAADVALSYADVAYAAFTGTLAGHPEPFDGLRGIAVLQAATVHLVVRPGVPVGGLEGLRGLRVGLGTAGSGAALTATTILEAHGLGPADYRPEKVRIDEAAPRLLAGHLDAMFVVGADPADAVRTAVAGGARILPLTGPPVEKLRHDYPFFRATLIRPGEYPGHPASIRTIGIDILLICRRDLAEELVHDLTRRLLGSTQSMPYLRSIDLEQAPAVPIPLHPGASRFYRERELDR